MPGCWDIAANKIGCSCRTYILEGRTDSKQIKRKLCIVVSVHGKRVTLCVHVCVCMCMLLFQMGWSGKPFLRK